MRKHIAVICEWIVLKRIIAGGLSLLNLLASFISDDSEVRCEHWDLVYVHGARGNSIVCCAKARKEKTDSDFFFRCWLRDSSYTMRDSISEESSQGTFFHTIHDTEKKNSLKSTKSCDAKNNKCKRKFLCTFRSIGIKRAKHFLWNRFASMLLQYFNTFHRFIRFSDVIEIIFVPCSLIKLNEGMTTVNSLMIYHPQHGPIKQHVWWRLK